MLPETIIGSQRANHWITYSEENKDKTVRDREVYDVLTLYEGVWRITITYEGTSASEIQTQIKKHQVEVRELIQSIQFTSPKK